MSFSHYVSLMRIPNIEERHFYEIEAARNGWGVKELARQYDSALCERLVLSRDKEGIAPPHLFAMQYAFNFANAKTGLALICPLRVIKT